MITEKEKMLSGAYYNSRDPELLKMYWFARKQLQKINQLNVEQQSMKEQLFKELLFNVGKDCWLETPFYCDYGKLISIGSGSFINVNAHFMDNNYITIGKNALIGPNVHIYTASHPIKAQERIVHHATRGKTSYRTKSQPVQIGDNVWIGGNCTLLPGVEIGNNVTLGAGSVVTCSIPDNVVAVGSPCKVTRTL